MKTIRISDETHKILIDLQERAFGRPTLMSIVDEAVKRLWEGKK